MSPIESQVHLLSAGCVWGPWRDVLGSRQTTRAHAFNTRKPSSTLFEWESEVSRFGTSEAHHEDRIIIPHHLYEWYQIETSDQESQH